MKLNKIKSLIYVPVTKGKIKLRRLPEDVFGNPGKGYIKVSDVSPSGDMVENCKNLVFRRPVYR